MKGSYRSCGNLSTIDYWLTEVLLPSTGVVTIRGFELHYTSGGRSYQEFVPWVYHLTVRPAHKG